MLDHDQTTQKQDSPFFLVAFRCVSVLCPFMSLRFF
jgi:hypothetical protein